MLTKYDGKDGDRILLTTNGLIFDGLRDAISMGLVRLTLHCQASSQLVLDGMHGNFAGRGASRGMAKQSFDLGANAWDSFHLLRTQTQKC